MRKIIVLGLLLVFAAYIISIASATPPADRSLEAYAHRGTGEIEDTCYYAGCSLEEIPDHWGIPEGTWIKCLIEPPR